VIKINLHWSKRNINEAIFSIQSFIFWVSDQSWSMKLERALERKFKGDCRAKLGRAGKMRRERGSWSKTLGMSDDEKGNQICLWMAAIRTNVPWFRPRHRQIRPDASLWSNGRMDAVRRPSPIFMKRTTGEKNNEAQYTMERLQKITRYIFKRCRDNFLKFYPDQLITYRSREKVAIGIARESQTTTGRSEGDDP